MTADSVMNGRDLVRRLFRRQPVERVPFLPVVFYLAARIDGAPARELIGEPPRLSRAVIELSRLLGSDSVAVRLESAVFAACGIELAWPSPDSPPVSDAAAVPNTPDAAALVAIAEPLLQSIVSVKAELRGAKSVIAVAPGPARLARRVGNAEGEGAMVAALRALVDAACKAGAEIIVIDDDSAQDEARLKRLAGPIINTARYYSASVVLALPRAVKERIADALLLPASEAQAASLSVPCGILPAAVEFADTGRLKALSERIAQAPAGVFVSLDDAAVHGREMSDILAGVAELLRRG